MGEAVSCCADDRDVERMASNRPYQQASPVFDSPDDSSVTLRVIIVSDIRRTDMLPRLKSLLMEKREEQRMYGGGKTVLVVAGDFLAPSPMSSFDKGMGIINLLNELPADYATWGDRDSMLCHLDAMRRVKEFNGIWINTNMQSHESFAVARSQVDAAVLELQSKNGHHRRRVGIMGLLADAPSVFRPRPFGGATVEDPWEALSAYKEALFRDRRCDGILPILHSSGDHAVDTSLFEDFPIVVDAGVQGSCIKTWREKTRLARLGSEGKEALVVDMRWAHPNAPMRPACHAELVSLSAYPHEPQMVKSVARAVGVLEPLHTAELAPVPSASRPLSSVSSRRRRTSMATLLLSHMRDALNYDEGSLASMTNLHKVPCDCAVSWGSNFHGNRDYADFEQITLEVLRNELDDSQELVVVPLPGHILRRAVEDAWAQAMGANGDWLQTDDGIEEQQGQLKTIAGRSLDPERVYQVATLRHAGLLESPVVAMHLEAQPQILRNCHAGWPQLSLVLWYYSEKLWEDLWSKLGFQQANSAEEAFRRLAKEPTASLEVLKRTLANMGGFETALNRFRHKTGRLGEMRAELGDLNMRSSSSADNLSSPYLPSTAPRLGSSGSSGIMDRDAEKKKLSPVLSKAWEEVGFKFGTVPATSPILNRSASPGLRAGSPRDRMATGSSIGLDSSVRSRDRPASPLASTMRSLGAEGNRPQSSFGVDRPLSSSMDRPLGALDSSTRSTGSELLSSGPFLKSLGKSSPVSSSRMPDPPRSVTSLNEPPRSTASLDPPPRSATTLDPPRSTAALEPPRSTTALEPPRSGTSLLSSANSPQLAKTIPATVPALASPALTGLTSRPAGPKVTVRGREGTIDWDGRPNHNYIVVRWCDDSSLSGALRVDDVTGLPPVAGANGSSEAAAPATSFTLSQPRDGKEDAS